MKDADRASILRAGAAAWARKKDSAPRSQSEVYGALEHRELDVTSHNLISEALHWHGFDSFVRAVREILDRPEEN